MAAYVICLRLARKEQHFLMFSESSGWAVTLLRWPAPRCNVVVVSLFAALVAAPSPRFTLPSIRGTYDSGFRGRRYRPCPAN
jgi:hypothetical protein